MYKLNDKTGSFFLAGNINIEELSKIDFVFPLNCFPDWQFLNQFTIILSRVVRPLIFTRHADNDETKKYAGWKKTLIRYLFVRGYAVSLLIKIDVYILFVA